MDVGHRGVLLDRLVQLLEALGSAVEPPARQDVRQRALCRLCTRARVLRDVAEGAAAQNQTCGWIVLRRQDFQQARLARAVTADQPDLVAGRDGEVGVGQHAPCSDVYGEVPDLEHASNCYLRG